MIMNFINKNKDKTKLISFWVFIWFVQVEISYTTFLHAFIKHDHFTEIISYIIFNVARNINLITIIAHLKIDTFL